MFSVNDGRYRYIRNQVTGNEELFDFVADRDEQHDLAKTPEGTRQLPAYREMLQAFTRVTSRH
jgi:hypothetical protein